MTMTEHEHMCHWCGMDDRQELADINVKIANAQVDFDHAIYRCGYCGKLTAEARWSGQQYIYRAIEYRRALRAPIYVLVYDVACGWCGRSDMIEPEEINATTTTSTPATPAIATLPSPTSAKCMPTPRHRTIATRRCSISRRMTNDE